MKIVVCVKQVPDTESRIRIAPDGKAIGEGELNWIVSPFDEFAIEEALRIKEKKGGEVVLVTLGPDRAQSALRSGLAMGADSAIHLKDALFEGLDTLGTAWALAAAIRPLSADLILAGQQGVGGDNGQVPGLLAEILDLPQVTMAVKIEIDDASAKATVERLGLAERYEVVTELGQEAGTDHLPFAEAGIPALSILHFPYEEYHLPEESLDLVDEQLMADAVELAVELVESQLAAPIERT